jgi:hypothetical protein
MAEMGMAIGGCVKRYNSGGIVSKMLGMFSSAAEVKDKKDEETKEPPLGTGMLRQTVDDIKRAKEERERQMKELGFAEGGGIFERLQDKDIFKKIMSVFGSSASSRDYTEELPLGTGMLRQTADDIKKRREEERRQLEELGMRGGGRLKRYGMGGMIKKYGPGGVVTSLEDLTMDEAAEQLGGAANMWADWIAAKRQFDMYEINVLAGKGTEKDKNAVDVMRDQLERAAGMMNSIRSGEFKPGSDIEAYKKYHKIGLVLQKYDAAARSKFFENIERTHGKDWLLKFFPNVEKTEENAKKARNAIVSELERQGLTLNLSNIPVPFSRETEIKDEKIPGAFFGGKMKKAGLTYLHGGEVVIPKNFAEGGDLESLNFDRNTINKRPSANIDTSEIVKEIESAIRSAIEAAEFPKLEVTDNLPMLDVDVTDKKIGVNTEGVVVPLSAEDAIAGIESAISKINAGPNAVGAERMDKIEELMEKLDGTVFSVKEDLEEKIEIINRDNVSRTSVAEMIQNATDPLRTEIYRNNSSGSEDNRRDLENTRQHLTAKIDALEGRLSHVQSYIGGGGS